MELARLWRADTLEGDGEREGVLLLLADEEEVEEVSLITAAPLSLLLGKGAVLCFLLSFACLCSLCYSLRNRSSFCTCSS